MSVKAKFIITDPIGIHARPATKLVQVANLFNSNILIHFQGKTANVKSIMNLMALGVLTNSEVEIEAKGLDENEAIAKLKETLIQEKLIDTNK